MWPLKSRRNIKHDYLSTGCHMFVKPVMCVIGQCIRPGWNNMSLGSTYLGMWTLRLHAYTRAVKLSMQSFTVNMSRNVGGNRGLLYLWFCLVNGLLLFIMQSLSIGESGDLADLLKFVVVELQDHPLDLSFSEQEYFYLREYDLLAGLAPLTKDEYERPLPSRVCVILHL